MSDAARCHYALLLLFAGAIVAALLMLIRLMFSLLLDALMLPLAEALRHTILCYDIRSPILFSAGLIIFAFAADFAATCLPRFFFSAIIIAIADADAVTLLPLPPCCITLRH